MPSSRACILGAPSSMESTISVCQRSKVTVSRGLMLVADEGEDVEAVELAAAVEEVRVPRAPRRRRPQPPSRATRSRAAAMVPPVARTSSARRTRPPGAMATASVWTIELRGAVFQGVLGADRLSGQLALLAGRNKGSAEFQSERRAEDEAARLDANDGVDAMAVAVGHQRDGVAHGARDLGAAA